MLGNLEVKSAALSSSATSAAVVQTTSENNYILFDNGSTLDINYNVVPNNTPSQTNWFNSTLEDLNSLFGGNING